MNREEVIKYLQQLHGSELIALLKEVFPVRPEVEDEGTAFHYKMFLGVAVRENISEDFDRDKWDNWKLTAVGYADENKYGKHFTGEPFVQIGDCENCNIEICSHVKGALCPICGSKVYLS